jgi:hypothetical protein
MNLPPRSSIGAGGFSFGGATPVSAPFGGFSSIGGAPPPPLAPPAPASGALTAAPAHENDIDDDEDDAMEVEDQYIVSSSTAMASDNTHIYLKLNNRLIEQ